MHEAHVVRHLRRLEIDPNEPRETAVVAKGRTIDAPVEGAEKEIAGFDTVKQEYTFRLPQKRFYPGQEISLPVSEAARLRRLGFLFDPDGVGPAETKTGRSGSALS